MDFSDTSYRDTVKNATKTIIFIDRQYRYEKKNTFVDIKNVKKS